MAGYSWRCWQPGTAIPPGAVRGGTDADGTTIYVGRAHYEGDLIPAKVIPEKCAAYVCHGGNEVSLQMCEVLCQQTFTWVPESNGGVPGNAVPVGHTSDGETLYAGRVYHEGSHTIGKVHPSHNTCYIPFGGSEQAHSDYEVLAISMD